MEHRMNLRPGPFEMIASGRKTIELRLWDEKRQGIVVGDTIVFRHTDDSARQVKTVVKALHRFHSFEALYAALPLDQCGYLPEELAQASHEDMLAYYSQQEQERWGVVGIAIELI